MFSKTYCAAITGIDAVMVQVEADVSNGLPSYDFVGYLASEVKEAKERVRVAIKNSRYNLPPKRVTINLSPADIRKEGTAFDLSIAVSILTAFGLIPEGYLKERMFIGELSLDGIINPVNGILSMVYTAKKNGIKECFVPKENAKEAAMIDGIGIIGVKTLVQTVDMLLGNERLRFEEGNIRQVYDGDAHDSRYDFLDIHGQRAVKRAIEVAVAGRHNILMIGSPGAGKTMLSRRIPTIMPDMEFDECIEVSRIYSVAGELTERRALITRRPFRSPHHTITRTALAGGGRVIKPGEICLASHGVLFLDEFPEFQRNVIEVLRQPLEERNITISRLQGSYVYPADFMLVAAMNPCPCGHYPDKEMCRCKNADIRRYLGRISRPILDRIDICVEVPAVNYKDIAGGREGARKPDEMAYSSFNMKERVQKARMLQKERYADRKIYYNSQLEAMEVNQICALGSKERALLERAFNKYKLSVRSYHRILKTARTIADLDGGGRINLTHVSEALSYRTIDKKFFDES